MPRITATTRRAAKRITVLTRRKKLSVKLLADFSGLSRGYVSRLLRGQQSPTLDTLEKLAKALEVEVRDLLD